MLSQFFLASLVVIIIIKSSHIYYQGRLSRSFTTLWLALWTAMLIVIAQPNILSKISQLVGIGRGADLALYLSILVVFFLIYLIFVKLNKLENQFTILIRQLALKNKLTPNKTKSSKTKRLVHPGKHQQKT